MANPQKENGYTAIANDIMEALAKTRISGEARQILDCIIRKTYGFNKKEDIISLSQFSLMTGLPKVSVIRARNMLLGMNLISINKKATNTNHNYKLNKDFDTWKPLTKKRRGLTILLMGGRKKAYELLTKKRHTKVDKVDITKDNIISQIKNLLKQFPSQAQNNIKTYWGRVATKNKSNTLTSGRKLTLLSELYNSFQKCNKPNLFNHALEMAISYDACNVGYINAVIKNKKMKHKEKRGDYKLPPGQVGEVIKDLSLKKDIPK